MIGALRGLVRVLAYEHPDLHAALVDVGAAADPIAALGAELTTPGDDDVIAWRGTDRLVERLARAAVDSDGAAQAVRPDGAYIVTGALGGLGLVVSRWLVDRGAGRIVLNGRSEPSEQARSALAELGERAEMEVVLGDIADADVAPRLVGAAEAGGMTLRGVIHAAAVIDDDIVATLDRESLARVWAPKAGGALRLHQATADRELDWWVGILLGRVAVGLAGTGRRTRVPMPGWTLWCAWRRAAGLPATAINWGQWSDVGLARALNSACWIRCHPGRGCASAGRGAGRGPRAGWASPGFDWTAPRPRSPKSPGSGFFSNWSGNWTWPRGSATGRARTRCRDGSAGSTASALGARLRARISAIMGYPGRSRGSTPASR